MKLNRNDLISHMERLQHSEHAAHQLFRRTCESDLKQYLSSVANLMNQAPLLQYEDPLPGYEVPARVDVIIREVSNEASLKELEKEIEGLCVLMSQPNQTPHLRYCVEKEIDACARKT